MKIKINGNLKLKCTPSNFKLVVPKEKILHMSGIYDKYVLLEDTSLLWEAWDKPRRLLFRCGHSGIRASMVHQSKAGLLSLNGLLSLTIQRQRSSNPIWWTQF